MSTSLDYIDGFIKSLRCLLRALLLEFRDSSINRFKNTIWKCDACWNKAIIQNYKFAHFFFKLDTSYTTKYWTINSWRWMSSRHIAILTHANSKSRYYFDILSVWNILESSANNREKQYYEAFKKTLIHIKNSKWPSIDLFGIPHVIVPKDAL